MASPRLLTSRAIGGCSLRQPTTFSPRSSVERSTTRHQQSAGRTELHQRFARTTTRERDPSSGRVRPGSRHPITESGYQDRVGHGFNWWHHPGTVEAPRQLLPSPGKTTSPTTRRQLWSIGAYSTPQGHSMAPLTSRSPTSTNMNLSRTQEAGWPSTPPPPEPLGQPRM
jgi:hypothetical protein